MPHEWIEIKERRWCIRCDAVQVRFAWGSGKWRPESIKLECDAIYDPQLKANQAAAAIRKGR